MPLTHRKPRASNHASGLRTGRLGRACAFSAITTFSLLAVAADVPAEPSDAQVARAAPATEPASAGVRTAGEREAGYVAKLDAIVAPLRDYDLSADDLAKLSAAFKALAKGELSKAAALQAELKDPVARRLIDWERLRRGKGNAAEYLDFLTKSPGWPSREALERRMEETLFEEGGDTNVIASYFKDGNARSAAGMAVLASVHLAQGQKDKAKELAAKVWRDEDLSAGLERGFLSRFGSMLSEDDHKWRLDRLLVEDVRWKADRERRAAVIRRVIPLLSEAEQKKAKARLDVFLRSGSKGTTLADKGKSDSDWGLVFHKVQKARRAGKLDEAAKLVLTAPTDPGVVANLDDWWIERRGLAYLALKENKTKLAYELVHDAGPLGANALNNQSFMAGWIALRHLKDAKQAEPHFVRLVGNADGPLTRARAHYWMGRTHEALGNVDSARASYKEASRFRDTFHGLLSLQKLSPGKQALTIDPPAMPTAQEADRFVKSDVARATALAIKAGLGRSTTRVFLLNLAKVEDNEAWTAMAAHLARVTGDTQTGVRIGKAAIARGQNMIYYSYPVHALPDYKPLRAPPEAAYLLGLARQETEFNSDTVSGAGARGILQVMKITANHVCRDYKIKCAHDRLLKDSSYNTMIASAYVADRIDDWAGSYVLGLSSYNAGPGRTRQWVREFGDPRQPDVDPIDWIERIPFEETRNYVAKVLSNIQVYRARLGEEATAVRIHEDLSRARARAYKATIRGASTADSRD